MGMNRYTGQPLPPLEHIRQSVHDILTTPIGTRTMNREYGSDLFDLVDAPMNASTKLAMISATHDAIKRWEPRIRLDAVKVEGKPGQVVLVLSATLLASGNPVSLEGITL
jgi:uncharacterized protein